jgi:hypothetical protein
MKRLFTRVGAATLLAGTSLLLLTPLTVSAHHIQGSIAANCVAGTVSVTVSNWSGNVEIKKLPSGPTTEKAPSAPNSTVVFSIAAIGGNGNYTAGRQGHPKDPTPVSFSVHCTAATPAPVNTTPTPSPLGGVQGVTSGGQSQSPTSGVQGIAVPGTGAPAPSAMVSGLGVLMTIIGGVTAVVGRRRATTRADRQAGR